jgi:AraC family transcriptional regulator of adaptative response / DNA-3-methyladenine glycosylase II
MLEGMLTDDACYRALSSRDARFDGWFFVCVLTTGIYCRPSCPAITPKRANVRFLPTAAAAQAAGFRACKRCRPDAAPGSPEWNLRADLVGRAMRHIADGVVDREGVAGLAMRLGYSERQVHRPLVAEVGAGPLALARAQRSQTARILLETTELPIADIAFAAGFSSVRQFNDTIRDVFATTPSGLRAARRPTESAPTGSIRLRLPFRRPFAPVPTFEFLAARAVSGVEEGTPFGYRRTLDLAHGPGIVELGEPSASSDPTVKWNSQGWIPCMLRLSDLRDLGAAVARSRRLLDLDADIEAIDDALARDPALGPAVQAIPGRRVPGHVDGFELAARAVLGQQVSVAAARTVAGRLAATHGAVPQIADDSLARIFPAAEAIADADPASMPMPRRRGVALVELARAVADGDVDLAPGADRDRSGAVLLALPGIGPWTVAYVRMRAFGDPDVFLSSDVGVRHGLEAFGLPGDARSAEALSNAWRPWRSYAMQHVWDAASAASRALGAFSEEKTA